MAPYRVETELSLQQALVDEEVAPIAEALGEEERDSDDGMEEKVEGSSVCWVS